MNLLRQVAPVLSRISTTLWKNVLPDFGHNTSQRYVQAFSSLTSTSASMQTQPFSGLFGFTYLKSVIPTSLCQMNPIQIQSVRTYKPKRILKKRCSSCYFVKRYNRLFVECAVHGRHKQMQIVSPRNLFREDVSSGGWKNAIFWKFQRNDRWYWPRSQEFHNYNWLQDRLGKDL
ncbi:hypothetical protein CHS0354_031052 [Potamilus streckersoni]|uniref:Large ribosomal subunit protein bL36m n=1 Tax=Potamilus streckersoni TaxID=2493646 RepID=A0AAE0TDT9_9BIVA|nr:hypothetical protein CHS0354_031052 [Potamilus streckersoni]